MTTKIKVTKVTISGWECWEREDRVRQAREKISLATVTWSFERGLGGTTHGVPTAVLGWLIKPLLRTAYAKGWAYRNGQLDGAEIPPIPDADDS